MRGPSRCPAWTVLRRTSQESTGGFTGVPSDAPPVVRMPFQRTSRVCSSKKRIVKKWTKILWIPLKLWERFERRSKSKAFKSLEISSNGIWFQDFSASPLFTLRFSSPQALLRSISYRAWSHAAQALPPHQWPATAARPCHFLLLRNGTSALQLNRNSNQIELPFNKFNPNSLGVFLELLVPPGRCTRDCRRLHCRLLKFTARICRRWILLSIHRRFFFLQRVPIETSHQIQVQHMSRLRSHLT